MLRLLPFPHPFRATIIFFVGMALRMPWRQKKLIDQATVLFLATLVVLLVVPAYLKGHPQETLVHRLLDLLMVFVTLLFLQRVGTHRWVVGAGGVVFLLHVVDLFVEGPPWLRSVSEVGMVLLFFLAIARMFQVLVLGKKVDVEMVLSTISGYLCLGFVFAIFFIVLDRHIPGSFRGPDGVASRQDLFYFSFVTLSTLGYGDVVPVRPEARSLAVLTAVIGQMYIALVMAMVVGKFIAGYKEEDSAS